MLTPEEWGEKAYAHVKTLGEVIQLFREAILNERERAAMVARLYYRDVPLHDDSSRMDFCGAIAEEIRKEPLCIRCNHPFHGYFTGEGLERRGQICSKKFDEDVMCNCSGMRRKP